MTMKHVTLNNIKKHEIAFFLFCFQFCIYSVAFKQKQNMKGAIDVYTFQLIVIEVRFTGIRDRLVSNTFQT